MLNVTETHEQFVLQLSSESHSFYSVSKDVKMIIKCAVIASDITEWE